jgi:hypothetical protein
MSPLHIIYIKSRFGVQVSLVLALSLISIFMHRSISNLVVSQSVLYYLPIYLFGISCSIHKAYLYEKLKGKDYLLLSLVLLIAGAQVLLGDLGKYEKNAFEYGGVDFLYLQKMTMCVFFMIWLYRFENYKSTLVDILAATSFSVFFLHGFMVFLISKVKGVLGVGVLDSWLIYSLIVVFIISVCVFVAIAVKKLIPKYSRYIIGY